MDLIDALTVASMSGVHFGQTSKQLNYQVCNLLKCTRCENTEHYMFFPYNSMKIYCIECDAVLSKIGVYDGNN